LEKVKLQLEEDIIESIEKVQGDQSERQVSRKKEKKKVKKLETKQNPDNSLIKSTAITLLKQKIGET
jgi:hypothetical protein